MSVSRRALTGAGPWSVCLVPGNAVPLESSPIAPSLSFAFLKGDIVLLAFVSPAVKVLDAPRNNEYDK